MRRQPASGRSSRRASQARRRPAGRDRCRRPCRQRASPVRAGGRRNLTMTVQPGTTCSAWWSLPGHRGRSASTGPRSHAAGRCRPPRAAPRNCPFERAITVRLHRSGRRTGLPAAAPPASRRTPPGRAQPPTESSGGSPWRAAPAPPRRPPAAAPPGYEVGDDRAVLGGPRTQDAGGAAGLGQRAADDPGGETKYPAACRHLADAHAGGGGDPAGHGDGGARVGHGAVAEGGGGDEGGQRRDAAVDVGVDRQRQGAGGVAQPRLEGVLVGASGAVERRQAAGGEGWKQGGEEDAGQMQQRRAPAGAAGPAPAMIARLTVTGLGNGFPHGSSNRVRRGWRDAAKAANARRKRGTPEMVPTNLD